MDSQLKSCYQEVYEAVREGFGRDETVTITDSSLGTERKYTGIRIELSQPLTSREDAQQLYTAFTTDNPQFFYIGSLYSCEGYSLGNVNYYNIFCIVFTMNAQERAAAHQEIEKVIRSILQGMSDISDQYEIELYLHDRLAGLCTYKSEADSADDPMSLYPTAFTAYGALVEGSAVCEGYSRAMQLLLYQAGIDCTLVYGSADNGISHMWNLVTIDGRNYHLDITWNDSGDMIQHTYFNLTTKDISMTHTMDSSNIGIDTCTATKANYFEREGLYLSTTSREEISAVIAKRVKQGDILIELRFSQIAFANARLFINNRELLTEMVNSCLAGTGLKMWDYDNYQLNETYSTITIMKNGSSET